MATVAELEARLAAIETRLAGAEVFAVPPVTVGELTDVPAPGSPILSAWAQEVSNRVTHRFATRAAMVAWNAADGSRAWNTADARPYTRVGGAWVVQPGATLARLYKQINTTAVTAETIVNELTTNFTVIGAANRTILVSAVLALFHTGGAAGDNQVARMKMDTATFASSIVQMPVNGTASVAILGTIDLAPGAHALTFTLQTSGGTMSVTALATCTHAVIDLGPTIATVP